MLSLSAMVLKLCRARRAISGAVRLISTRVSNCPWAMRPAALAMTLKGRIKRFV